MYYNIVLQIKYTRIALFVFCHYSFHYVPTFSYKHTVHSKIKTHQRRILLDNYYRQRCLV
jgi:hypothetical protein